MKEPYSEQQLLEKYGSAEWRSKLLEIVDITDFLEGCVIRSDYRISDALNSSIALSDSGTKMVRDLGKAQGAEKVPTKEARLMCLLHLAHVELLIDPEKMEPEALAKAISEELLAGEILLPYIHGPALYERAAELFAERRRFLGITDTIKLLDGMPIGVFQSGHWVSGPLGLIRSATKRHFEATRRIPLQHCHDLSCSLIHMTSLDTDSQAPINSLRHRAHRYHDIESDTPSEWSKYLATISSIEDKLFDDFDLSTTFAILGDGLDLNERRLLVAWLLDNTSGELRGRLELLGRRGRASEIVRELQDAEALQIALLCSDAHITKALDALVFQGSIKIPDGEVRRPVLRRGLSHGIFRVRLEVSSLGTRLSARADVASMRLRRLVEHIYPIADIDAMSELEWQLRGTPGVSLEARLDEFLRTASPHEVLLKLVLSRKSHVEKASHELNLTVSGTEDDETLIDRALWKLGFDVDVISSLRSEYWSAHERLRQAAQTANVSTLIDYELVRSVAASYFVKLEEFLGDTLAFGTWVLINDHAADRHPFKYDFETGKSMAFGQLEAFDRQRNSNPDNYLKFAPDVTLYPLVRGFECLAELLATHESNIELLRRDESQYPKFEGRTELQRFPFHHTVPFLDLVPSARTRILQSLTDISALLVRSEIASARNDQLHFRRSVADLDALMKTLDLVSTAVQKIEVLGIIRDLFYPDKTENDRWGRRTIYLSNRRGKEIALARPTSYGLLSLPSLSEAQYIVTSAQFAEPNDMIRIVPASNSPYSKMWSKFPQRRQRTSVRSAADRSLELESERFERDRLP